MAKTANEGEGNEPATAVAGSKLTSSAPEQNWQQLKEQLEAATPVHVNGTDNSGFVWLCVSKIHCVYPL